MNRGGARHPLIELTLARVREFVREPEALFWTFIFPIIISVALAAAFPGGRVTPVLVGLEPGPAAAAVRRTLTAQENITVRDIAPREQARAIREGTVHVVVVPLDPPVYLFDPARDESRIARLVVDAALKRAAGRQDPWEAREEPMVVAGSRYVDWMIPGIVGMTIMGTGMWGVAFSIVQARLRKVLKRLAASPMRRSEYLLAQICARLVFLVPEVVIPFGFGVLALGLPILGSYGAIAVVCLVGAVAFSAIGLLAAARPRTFEGISGLLNLLMLPMWILSGVFFSSANFPGAVQPFVQALPLTALIDALRAVVLEGAMVEDITGELLLLGVWTVVPFSLSMAVFRWR